MTRQIRVSEFKLEMEDRDRVNAVLDSGWIKQGPMVEEFEDGLAKMAWTKHAVACSSGTAALHLILLALGIGPQDAVIVPSLTYVATANAARYVGAKVFFCDIDPHTWCIDVKSAARLARHLVDGYRRVVIIPVHLFDAVAPVNELHAHLHDLSAKDVLVVEDAAHAPGAMNRIDRVGSLGYAAAFSFFASKVVATGEGGAITTNNDAFAAKLRLYRGQGAPTPGEYYHTVVGYNYRMTDMQAAIGIGQLARLQANIEVRRRLSDYYRIHLPSYTMLQAGEKASAWTMPVLLPPDTNRDAVKKYMKTVSGVETRSFFIPIPDLPPYDSLMRSPVAEDVAARGLLLPLHLFLDNSDVDYVCTALDEAVNEVAEERAS